jgi:hypothetical protein
VPFRVTKANVVIDVPTSRDLKAVLDLLGVLPNGSNGSNRSRGEAAEPAAADDEADADDDDGPAGRSFAECAAEVLASLRKPQLDLISALASHPGGLTDAQLRARLGYDGSVHLDGVLAVICKLILESGREPAEYFERGNLFPQQPTAIGYRLTSAFLEEVRKHARKSRPELELAGHNSDR